MNDRKGPAGVDQQLVNRLKVIAGWSSDRIAMVAINRHQAAEILQALRRADITDRTIDPDV